MVGHAAGVTGVSLEDGFAWEREAGPADHGGAVGGWADRLAAYLSGDLSVDLAAVPLAVDGTAFQRGVWSALRAIPAGQTRTYTELAAMMDRPDAVRAAASACGRNPAAVLIPCHRVVRRDGRDCGFSWGMARKHALLALERGGLPGPGGAGGRRSRRP